jgi:hypothetical protein
MKKNRKSSALAIAPAVETSANESSLVETSVTPASVETKAEKKVLGVANGRKLFGRSSGSKDPYGFGDGTINAFLAARLAEGTYTKASLKAALAVAFPGSSPKASTYNVFFSDGRKPLGTYSTSRSFRIFEESDGRLTLDPVRDDRVREAIGAGVLDRIRGKAGSERESILREYGLPATLAELETVAISE